MTRDEIRKSELVAQIMAGASHEQLAAAALDYMFFTGWTQGSKCGTLTKLSAGIFDEPVAQAVIDELSCPF